MDPREIICDFYPPGTPLYDLYMRHAEQVTQKSLDLADAVSHLNPDTGFIQEAAMLHDIGIGRTRAPEIHCHGDAPYICHGVLGRELLDQRGFPRHALVAERHTGAGITLANIVSAGLPLPHRDMVPVCLEEEIICAADKFYSKTPGKNTRAQTVENIIHDLSLLSPSHGKRFARWMDRFNEGFRSHRDQFHTSRSSGPG